MRQRCRQMPRFDGTVEQFWVVGAYCVYEVFVVVAARISGGVRGAFSSQKRFVVIVAIDDDAAFVAVKQVA